MSYERWALVAALLSTSATVLGYLIDAEFLLGVGGILAGVAIVCWVQR